MTRRSNWDIFVSLRKISLRPSDDGINVHMGEIAKGGFITFLGLSFSSVANFTFQIILTRAIGTASIGLFNLGLTLSGLFSTIILLGLDRGVVHYIAFYREKQDQARELGIVQDAVKLITITTLLTVPILWITSEEIATSIFHKPELVPILQVFILSTPFIALIRLWGGILLGYKQISWAVSIEQVFLPMIRIIGLVVVLFTMGSAITQITYSYFYTSLMGFGLVTLIGWRYYKLRRGNHKPLQAYSQLLSFSLPLMFVGLLNRTNTYTETLVLGALSTSEQVGFYTVSYKVAATLAIFFEATNFVLAPYITEAFARGDIERLDFQYKTVTRWSFLLTFPVALIMLLEAQEIMLIFGPAFVDGVPILQILAISQLIYSSFGPAAVTLTMTGHSFLNLSNLILTLLFSIALDLILIPGYGAYGAALTGAITIIFVCLLRLIQVYFVLHMHPFNRDLFTPIIAGVVSVMVAILLRIYLADWFYIWHLGIVSVTLLFSYVLVSGVIQHLIKQGQFSIGLEYFSNWFGK
ncbi:MAG: flippase [Chloroflexota bacterium]